MDGLLGTKGVGNQTKVTCPGEGCLLEAIVGKNGEKSSE